MMFLLGFGRKFLFLNEIILMVVEIVEKRLGVKFLRCFCGDVSKVNVRGFGLKKVRCN